MNNFKEKLKVLIERDLKKGFTLAEVLITLGIIGVVAALTIPSLINNYQKTQYVSQLKKAYTVFNQALIQMASDNGCVGDLKCTGFFAVGTTRQTLGTELVKYFKVVKNCESIIGGPSLETGCFSGFVFRDVDGGTKTTLDPRPYLFITADGVSISVDNYSNNCANNNSVSGTGALKQWCAMVVVDLNGPRKPNTYGRDLFKFYIANGKGPSLYPVGGSDDTNAGYYPLPNGEGGSGRIIDAGWQMQY